MRPIPYFLLNHKSLNFNFSANRMIKLNIAIRFWILNIKLSQIRNFKVICSLKTNKIKIPLIDKSISLIKDMRKILSKFSIDKIIIQVYPGKLANLYSANSIWKPCFPFKATFKAIIRMLLFKPKQTLSFHKFILNPLTFPSKRNLYAMRAQTIANF